RIVVHSEDGTVPASEIDRLRDRLGDTDHVATVSDARYSADRDTAVVTVGYDVPVTDRSIMGNADGLEKAVAPTIG
ncbi:MMPL family transporter, partial [Streptomyces sp. SID10244]|nr:MMPL family transporter [Streptomyces sp. SID10244]